MYAKGDIVGLGFLEDDGQTFKKGVAVLAISEKFPPFNSPGHDVLEEVESVQSGLVGHSIFLYCLSIFTIIQPSFPDAD